MNERIPTSERLAKVLDERGLDILARNARRFLYDDYKSPEVFNMTLLVSHLESTDGDHSDLIRRVAEGEFDAQEWEADEWAASSEGQSAFQSLLRRPNPPATGAFGQPL